jgi:hypothetical protein
MTGIAPDESPINEEVERGYASTKDLARGYYQTYHKTIGSKRLKKMIDLLLESGLIIEDKDPEDGRITVYSHPEGYLFSEEIHQ